MFYSKLRFAQAAFTQGGGFSPRVEGSPTGWRVLPQGGGFSLRVEGSPPGWRVLPYMGYRGIRRPKGCGVFCVQLFIIRKRSFASFAIYRVCIFASFAINRGCIFASFAINRVSIFAL